MKLARVVCSLSLAALATAGPCLRAQANVQENEPAVLYVNAQSGSDSNSGSSASPLKTIQAAVNKANANNQKSIGTKVIVAAGVYREMVSVSTVTGQTTAPLTIEAASNGTAIISASELLTGWSGDPQYSGAYMSNWSPAQSTCALPSGWPAVQEIALHTEMMFVNGIAMTQVLAYADLKPGTFYVSTADGTVHLWPPAGIEPTSATIEVASRAKTISVYGRSNVVLRGLVLEHAASCINRSGATISSSNNVLVDSVQANWNNFGGLGIYSSNNVTVQNSIASYNGGVGLQGTKDQNTVYSNNETDYNNWRGAQAAFYDWAMGGMKLFQMRTTSVQGHRSFNNQAQGLWFDTDNQNITIDDATLAGSYNAALQLERNEGPITLENSHLCSSGAGVNVLTTEGLTVKNNVFYNNGATNKYQAQFYLAGTAGGFSLTNWQTGQIYDLVTSGTVLSGNQFIDAAPGQYVFGTYLSGADWTDFTSSLTSGNNTWYDPNTTNAFHVVNGKNVNLAGWQAATGADYDSTWASPSTSPASACAAPAPSYADFNVSVDSGAYTMTSGLATATVRVNSFNDGAVILSMSGLPAGVTASFSVPSLTSGFSTLTLAASSTSVAQTVPVTLWAVSGDRVHSVTFKLTVSPNLSAIGTTTSLSASSSSVTEGSTITLTATVKPASGTTTPTGSVTFYEGSSALGTSTLSGGTATLSTTAQGTGTDSMTAVYSGASGFNGSSSNTVSVSVSSAAVSTSAALAVSSSSVTQGSPVTLTATVKQLSGTTTPAGTVTFYNGSVSIGAASLSGGVAAITTTSLPLGSDSVSAAYSGAAGFSASTSSPVVVTVNAPQPATVKTTTALAASATNITQNSAVTLTATVKQASGTTLPTGAVTFLSGSTAIGTAQLSGGTATFTTSALSLGVDVITASYDGASGFSTSSSAGISITVSPAIVSTTTSLSASSTNIAENAAVTFTANVKQSSGSTTPTGSVAFYDGSSSIGSAALSSGIATLTTSSLGVGQHTVTSVYAGAAGFGASNSGSVTVTVTAPSAPPKSRSKTTTTVSSSTPQADQGFTISLTAAVSAPTGSPTGLVEFTAGTQKLGSAPLSNGRAYLNTSALQVGANAITASYTGDDAFAPSSSDVITIKIFGPDFTIAATPSTITATPGESVSVKLLITPQNGFNQTPAFRCGGLPAGANCTFGTPAKQADGTFLENMTIRTAVQTANRAPTGSARALFALAFLPFFLWIAPKRRRQFRAMMLPVVLAAIVILGAATIGCGGSPNASSTQTSATNSTAHVTVTAETASGLKHTAQLKLILN